MDDFYSEAEDEKIVNKQNEENNHSLKRENRKRKVDL